MSEKETPQQTPEGVERQHSERIAKDLETRLEAIVHERLQLEAAVNGANTKIQEWVARHKHLGGAEEEIRRLISSLVGEKQTNVVPFPSQDEEPEPQA